MEHRSSNRSARLPCSSMPPHQPLPERAQNYEIGSTDGNKEAQQNPVEIVLPEKALFDTRIRLYEKWPQTEIPVFHPTTWEKSTHETNHDINHIEHIERIDLIDHIDHVDHIDLLSVGVVCGTGSVWSKFNPGSLC